MNPCQILAQVATPFECIILIHFLDHLISCKETMLNLDPNLLKITRMKVLLYLTLPKNSIVTNHLPVEQQYTIKFTAVNFRC